VTTLWHGPGRCGGATIDLCEVEHDERLRNNLIHFGAFVGGIAAIVVTRVLLEG
jgi:hypothetical protein